METTLQLVPDDVERGSFIDTVNDALWPKSTDGPLVLDLFAGCGGLGLGFEAAGFSTLGYEMEPDYAASYSRNLRGDCLDEFLTDKTEFPEARVIIGGPPCQPFSVSGSQRGMDDHRNGFPAFLSAVRRKQPSLALIENVRGMLYRNRPYLDQALADLREMGYIVEVELLNARHYGVPQNRERIVIIAHRGGWEWPARNPGPLVTAGEALGVMAYSSPSGSRFLTESMDRYIAAYEAKSKCIRPRDLHLDRPARTVTCRNLAGATSDMHRIRLPDGRRRRLMPREAARLQSFPDWFEFVGSEMSIFYQVGNAVPPLLALKLGQSVRSYLACMDRVATISAS